MTACVCVCFGDELHTLCCTQTCGVVGWLVCFVPAALTVKRKSGLDSSISNQS